MARSRQTSSPTSTTMQTTTVAELEQMDAETRYATLGNLLYPRVFPITHYDEALAGKVTGMLLEMPLEVLVEVTSQEAADAQTKLAGLVAEAMSVLPPMASPDTVLAPSGRLDAASTNLEPTDLAEALEGLHVEPAWAALAAQLGWDYDYYVAQPAATCSEFVVERLQERNDIIVNCVVEELGAAVALRLLVRTEEAQEAGGMLVPETGKPRSSGGIYLKLLKEATDLPAAEQAAAVQRIKAETNGKKKGKKQQVSSREQHGPSTISLDVDAAELEPVTPRLRVIR